MKKRIKTNVLRNIIAPIPCAMGMMLSAMGMTSCGPNDDINNSSEYIYDNVLELDPNPTSDQYGMKYDGKTVVLGTGNTYFNSSVLGRLTSTSDAFSDDAKAYVFTKDYNMDFTVDQMAAMIKAYLNGANFILIEPTFSDLTKLETTATEATKKLVAEGVDVTGVGGFFGKIDELKKLDLQNVYKETEVIAFRQNDIYVIPDLKELATLSSSNATGLFGSENGTTEEKKCVQDDYEPTDYDRGVATDNLVNWMVKGKDFPSIDTGENSGEASTIDKYMQGERFVIQQQVGPSRAMGKTLNYEMVYIIYSAYNFDTDTDYYFIRLRPNFKCSAFNCPTDAGTWIHANKVVTFDDGHTSGSFWSKYDDRWYGTYMSAFDFTGDIVRADKSAAQNVTLLDASPKTDVSGSTGYTTGLSYSISGDLGFNMNGPTGGVHGGMTFSESTTQTLPDLKVRHSENGPSTFWGITGVVPTTHHNVWTGKVTHDLVGTFQRTDWQTEFTWIVSIKNPSSQTSEPFLIKATDRTEITDLNSNLYDYELRVHPTQTNYIKLPIPNRFRNNFIVTCSDNNLQNVLKDQFSKTWLNEFTYYGKSNDEVDKGAVFTFNNIKTAVKGYLNEIVSKGYTETYTFRLKTTDGKELATFKIENGKIVE